MNNDFISRSALKDAKFLTPQVKVIGGRHSGKLKEQIILAYQKGWNDCIDAIIDNAPTVEIATNLQPICNNLQQRPQGEWVGNAFNEHHCNRCGHPALWEEEPDDYYEVQSRFCPNCGADMRGKDHE